MGFLQDPPRLGNQYDDDILLKEYLTRVLPDDMHRACRDSFAHLGALAGGSLFEFQKRDRQKEPVLTQWDAWGRRIDAIELTPLWTEAQKLAAEWGLVAIAYERRHAEHSRVHQFALNYLVDASLDVYSCPLAMTDGAARTLLALGNAALIDRAVPRLTSRDPKVMWTSGQWMTERTGGSDVAISETVAKSVDGAWRLFGTKWFTSAATSDMALTLARPEGNPAGGKGLALFYLECNRDDGSKNGLVVHRLKDKLGTRKVPTAELSLENCLAVPVAGLTDGIRNISPMLNVTRVWNAVGAISGMRRALALTRDYAQRRVAFGNRLAEKPLHVDTLAGMQAEFEGAFHLTFRAIELLGRSECGLSHDSERALLRVVTPLAKLTTAKQAVSVASETLECFGGAGYVEDTGLPRILRDAQVLPIWEGTTNVLSIDVLRALAQEGTWEALTAEIQSHLSPAKDASLKPCVEAVRRALAHSTEWIGARLTDPPSMEAGARRLALTLGRTLELALLVHHAQWCLDRGNGRRPVAAARRIVQHGVDLIVAGEASDSTVLAT